MPSSLIYHRNKVWFVVLLIGLFVHVELKACGKRCKKKVPFASFGFGIAASTKEGLAVQQKSLVTASNVDFTYTIPDKNVCFAVSRILDSFKECPKTTFLPTSLPSLPPSSSSAKALWSLGRPVTPGAGWR